MTKEEVLLLFNLEDNDNTVNNSDGVKERRLTQLGNTAEAPVNSNEIPSVDMLGSSRTDAPFMKRLLKDHYSR
jgi:hypothetical protein